MVLTKKHKGSPGQRLKAIRKILGLTTRDVQELSSTISRARGNPEYYISQSSLTGIENSEWTPSIYKLWTLSTIYQVSYIDVMLMFGVNVEETGKAQLAVRLPERSTTKAHDASLPVKYDSTVGLGATNQFSSMLVSWGEVPISLIQHLDLQKYLYGYIGLDDYTMYPLLRPGSFVRIDETDTRVHEHLWENEFDRPIYFLELQEGYACGWCQLQGGILKIVPHPFSQRPVRQLSHPKEVEIVGRVTGIAMPLVSREARIPEEKPRRKQLDSKILRKLSP